MKRQGVNTPPGLNAAALGSKVDYDKTFFENKIVFLSIHDVAACTGYSIGTLYNLTSRNLIPHRKKRGKLYFVPLEIQNWIEEGDI